MNVVLLDEARRRFESEDEWWRQHRDAKELFLEEFERTLELLSAMPGVGPRYRLAGKPEGLIPRGARRARSPR